MRKILLLLVLLLPLVFLLFTSCSEEENPKIPIVDDVYGKIEILQGVQYGDELSTLTREFGRIRYLSEPAESSHHYGWKFVDKKGNNLTIEVCYDKDQKIIGLWYFINHSLSEDLINENYKPETPKPVELDDINEAISILNNVKLDDNIETLRNHFGECCSRNPLDGSSLKEVFEIVDKDGNKMEIIVSYGYKDKRIKGLTYQLNNANSVILLP